MTTMEQDEKTPGFEALRAARNRGVLESMQRLADEEQIPLEFFAVNYWWESCYCACASGGRANTAGTAMASICPTTGPRPARGVAVRR